MKIVDVSAFYSPHGGGVKTYVENKLRFGTACGHEVTIIAPGARTSTEKRMGGGKIRFLESPAMPIDRRYRYFADVHAVHRMIAEEAPDILEASSPWRTASIVADYPRPVARTMFMHADPLAAYAYRWFGSVTDRETIDRGFQWFWNHLRRTSRKFDLVVSANALLSRRLSTGGVVGTCTIPLGVDSGIFSPHKRDAALRSELLGRCALPPGAFLLLAVGRLSAEKRWPVVIDACQRAGLNRPIGLVLIGDGRDRSRILRHIAGNPHVVLLAPISDRETLARVMASADALIHGCEAETFGLVAAEAAASGLPLVVPNEGGATDLAAPDCSETYAVADAASAAQAIDRLMARNPAQLYTAAHKRAADARTIEGHFYDLFEVYADILEQQRRAA